MILDEYSKSGRDGWFRRHYTEPGRNCTVHTWDVSDDKGFGLSLSALERGEMKLGDMKPLLAAFAIAVAVGGAKVDVMFTLDQVQEHQPRRNGFCAIYGHQGCESSYPEPTFAQRIWVNVGNWSRPTDDSVFEALIAAAQGAIR